ncbi:MAG TPA: hypothetical protein VLL50_14820 [Usitatibacter sp.]|nr:hypothetical protein [Usitatibacter sp.]
MRKSSNEPRDIEGRVFFVDVDGTLERKILGIEVPLKNVCEGVRLLKRQGALVYLWSTGGASHARKAAREAKIEKLVDGFLPKPNVYVDDEPVRDWKDCERWKPKKLSRLAKDARK